MTIMTMTMKGRYINPFTDFGFKKIFGSEVNKDLLIACLNSLLPDDAVIIAGLSLLPLNFEPSPLP